MNTFYTIYIYIYIYIVQKNLNYIYIATTYISLVIKQTNEIYF